MPPPVSSFSLSKTHDLSILQNAYPQLQSVQDLGQVTINSLSRQQQQHHSFFGSEFGSSEPVKHETQLLRPFFDEWPKTRDSWSDLEEDRSNRTSFSTTQLSISIPIASSDFSSTSSRSPNGGSPSWTTIPTVILDFQVWYDLFQILILELYLCRWLSEESSSLSLKSWTDNWMFLFVWGLLRGHQRYFRSHLVEAFCGAFDVIS